MKYTDVHVKPKHPGFAMACTTCDINVTPFLPRADDMVVLNGCHGRNAHAIKVVIHAIKVNIHAIPIPVIAPKTSIAAMFATPPCLRFHHQYVPRHGFNV